MKMAWKRALCLSLLFLPSPLAAQPEDSREEDPSGYRFGVEVKGHWRDSEAIRFESPFPFTEDMRPPGPGIQPVFFETVEPGGHAEVSVVTLWMTVHWQDTIAGKLKVDLIDRHDRNPTSEDQEWDVDEAWLRFGRETEPGNLPDEPWQGYLKIGKFAKFDRQDDRHLESYGLISTAFNRFEDVGLEAGVDLGRRVYLKGTFTGGNPVFIRDPNALAGDNGTSVLRRINPIPELGAGISILYETDVDDLDFEVPETGLGLGVRLGSEAGPVAADVLAWAFDRELAETVDLNGTFYGGDLDLLRGPLNQFGLPITGTDKTEWGANVWLYAYDFTFFGQIVEQDLAGLRRDGWEAEASWTFELPYVAGAFGRQLFSFIQPAARYSKLDPQFGIDRASPFPAPSVTWEWEKIDLGLRLGLVDRMIDLTLEWNDNNFITAGGERGADEFLATVRWEMDWGR